MEDDIKKQMSHDIFIVYSDESDSDNEVLTASNLKKYLGNFSISGYETDIAESKTYNKRNGKERLPTRRPDPNVYNRNALLARENRKKKKLYLETIEKELILAKKANRVLLKALKHQIKIRRQLEEENMNFRGVDVFMSESLQFQPDLESPSTSETSSFESLHILNSDNVCGMASYSNRMLGGETESECADSTSHDFENEVSCLQTTSLIWDDKWSHSGTSADCFTEKDSSISQRKNILRDVNSDHCYFENSCGSKHPEENYLNDKKLDTGEVCSHHIHEFFDVFCPTCINPECQTPPLQLLENNL